jgi:cupin fold WbuC family metalloprotein
MTIKVFSASYLDDLVLQAVAAPRRRQHRNIHADYADPCQRVFNAIEPDSYLRPHRHGPAQGAETMLAVRGLFALVVFDDVGNIAQVQRFGAGPHVFNLAIASGTETPPGRWHTVVSLESGSVLLEIKAGPFEPSAPKFSALWAPEEGTSEGEAYLNELVNALNAMG